MLVVIDEAYLEFVTDPDAPDGIATYRERPNVAVLRTFSKAYGLAGLRVGYAVAHEPVAQALRKTAVPFGVSEIAQAGRDRRLDAAPSCRCASTRWSPSGRGSRGPAGAGLGRAADRGQLRLAAAG